MISKLIADAFKATLKVLQLAVTQGMRTNYELLQAGLMDEAEKLLTFDVPALHDRQSDGIQFHEEDVSSLAFDGNSELICCSSSSGFPCLSTSCTLATRPR